MKLQTYIDTHNLTDGQFGQRISKDASLVSRYRRGDVVPSLDVIAQIEAVTSGAVSFRDFLKSRESA